MSQLPTYDGELEGVLPGNESELLYELLGLIDATLEKSIKLTKSGIPPKPLWSSVNDRLLWQDPKSILYDWDEVDQVRFVYSLGLELDLIQPDHERVLGVGPGADPFFFAPRTRRAKMLLRAYRSMSDWDERCDARNNQGHRHNFGQTFRRDFLHTPSEVRGALLDALSFATPGEWVRAKDLATRITTDVPSLLISEDDDVPDTPDGEPHPEVLRLVEYWVYLAARIGLIDLARTPEVQMNVGGDRLVRLTSLGARLLRDADVDEAGEIARIEAARPFVLQPNHDIVFYRAEGDVGDEYLARRLSGATDPTDPDEPVSTWAVSMPTIRAAIEDGLDPKIVEARLFGRSRTDVPATLTSILADVTKQLGNVVISRGFTAVELDSPTKKLKTALKKAGFEVIDDLALVPWREWQTFVDTLGEEPTEGFRYPSDEPLVTFTGDKVELAYLRAPLAGRELLDALGLDGEAKVALDADRMASLAEAGWTPRAVAETFAGLAETLPKKLKSALSSR